MHYLVLLRFLITLRAPYSNRFLIYAQKKTKVAWKNQYIKVLKKAEKFRWVFVNHVLSSNPRLSRGLSLCLRKQARSYESLSKKVLPSLHIRLWFFQLNARWLWYYGATQIVTSRLFQIWCSCGVVTTGLSRKTIGISSFFRTFRDTAVARDQHFNHGLCKPPKACISS